MIFDSVLLVLLLVIQVLEEADLSHVALGRLFAALCSLCFRILTYRTLGVLRIVSPDVVLR